MFDFSIGLSALTAGQRTLDIIGENLSNANTPGYHRQVPGLTERPPIVFGNLSLGTGVDVADIRRLRSQLIETSINQNTFQFNSTDSQLTALQQVQTQLSPGLGSLDGLITNFFNQLDQLTAKPDDMVQRRVFLESAVGLANQFNSLANNLDEVRQGVEGQLQDSVNQINSIVGQIADLNGQIQSVELRGTNANDLRDQRDQFISQLSQFVDVKVIDQGPGQSTVLAAGVPVVVGNTANKLQYGLSLAGNAIVIPAGSPIGITPPLKVEGGKLQGLLKVHNEALPAYQRKLDTLAHGLAKQVDAVHSTGLGLNGPASFLDGSRGVNSPINKLAQAGLAFPPQKGSLFISVTDQATGLRTTSKIDIDPATQTLQDVAASISAIPHLQGLVDAQTGTLKVIAQPGFAFDFAGRLPSKPDTTAITGTTTVQLSGTYKGPANDVLTYTVVNPGGGTATIGVTPNLTLQVKNSAGTTVASLNIGQGYEAGTALQLGNGIVLKLSSGTANGGDNFTTQVVAQPDTAKILPALGLNTFFTGDKAANLGVQPNLVSNPDLFAGSRTGQPGDSSNLKIMAGLRDSAILANGTQNFGQFYGSIVGDVGTQVHQLTATSDAQKALGQQLKAQQQSISGVDPNEETVHLVEAQRAFQAAARYISVVNTTLDSLFQILGP